MTSYQERLRRMENAAQLKIPDRVPVLINTRYFPAKYAGITCEDAFYNYEKWSAASRKVLLDFQPDMFYTPAFGSGLAYEILGIKTIKWPGHGVSPKHTHQYIEKEYMAGDEYDIFLKDPSDFIVRFYLPRVMGSLAPFCQLPSLKNLLLHEDGGVSLLSLLGNENLLNVVSSLIAASRSAAQCIASMKAFCQEAADLGFPSMGPVTHTAFDIISDYLRGMRGAMLDMYRQPGKILQAIEVIEPVIIESSIKAARDSNTNRISIMLHKGADTFMADEQFRTFYWPSLKRLLVALTEAGITPCAYIEGGYNSRLEYFDELPEGKIIAHFDKTDLFMAKKIIGKRVCICGNVPVSLMQFGKPDEIKDYCSKLIETVGRDGGYIMSTSSVMDEVDPANLRIMIEHTWEHGVY